VFVRKREREREKGHALCCPAVPCVCERVPTLLSEREREQERERKRYVCMHYMRYVCVPCSMLAYVCEWWGGRERDSTPRRA